MSRQRQAGDRITIPDAIRSVIEERLDRYCDQRVPSQVRDEVHLGWKARGTSLTLVEYRRHFIRRDEWIDIKIAQFRYDTETGAWTLYCADRNSKWHEYFDLDPSTEFEALLAEVEEDPTGIFWG